MGIFLGVGRYFNKWTHCFKKILFVYIFIYLFVWKVECSRESYRKRERSSKHPQQPGWDTLDAGTKNVIWISHGIAGAQVLRSSCAASQVHWQEVDYEVEAGCEARHSEMKYGHSKLQCNLLHHNACLWITLLSSIRNLKAMDSTKLTRAWVSEIASNLSS